MNDFLADTNVTYERKVESAQEHHKDKMQTMHYVAYDAHPEFVLDEVDFVLVEIIIVTLGTLLRILLLPNLLVSTIKVILNFDCFDFLLVE